MKKILISFISLKYLFNNILRKQKKFIFYSLLVTVVSFISLISISCSSMVTKNAYKNAIVTNNIPLHINPTIGDYALYQDESKNIQYFEITSIQNQEITIKSIINNYDWYFEYVVDLSGNTKRAFLVDSNGDKIPMKIAIKDQDGYLEPSIILPIGDHIFLIINDKKKEIGTELKVPAGTFKYEIVCDSYKLSGGEYRRLRLINKKIPFNTLQLFAINNTNGKNEIYGYQELVKFGNKLQNK